MLTAILLGIVLVLAGLSVLYSLIRLAIRHERESPDFQGPARFRHR